MSDAVLALFLLVVLASAGAWIACYRLLVRRLRARHHGLHGSIFGTPSRPRNSMDRFFGVVAFVLRNGHRDTAGDGVLVFACIAMKLATVFFFLGFLAMTFGPFFLRLKNE